MRREVDVWSRLNHPNILPFYGIEDELFKPENILTIITPWMELGSLDNFVANPGYEPKAHRERFVSSLLFEAEKV